jgi:carboxymethylenebutenolidase
VIEQHIEIETADGVMNTFVTHPEDGGPHPVVLFYMDAPGKREELHEMARRISSTGYYVVLPNLYYRRAKSFVVVRDDPASVAEMRDHMASLSNADVVSDTAAMLALVDVDPAADASRIGCVGYCMSGPFSLCVAAAYPDRVAAAASIYGVRLATDAPDSPHSQFDQVRGELYIACAEHDEHAPPEMIDRVEAALASSGAAGRVEWYPGAYHGFAFPQRAVYDRASAERHWERLHSLFARCLAGTPTMAG